MLFRRSPLSYGRYRRPFAKLCYVVFLVIAAAFWNLYDAISHSQRLQSYPAANHEPISGDNTEDTNNQFPVQLPLVPVSDVHGTPSESRHQDTRSVVFVPNIRPQADLKTTSPAGNGYHNVRPHSKTEHRNDGYAHVDSSGPRVARKKSQTVAGEAHNQDDGDVTVFIRNMPAKQELAESAEQKGRRVTTGLFEDYPVRGAQDSSSYHFPTQDECDNTKEKADTLPDMLVIPFEDAVQDINLEGWEDDWVSKARYTGPKLIEPKLDFVYNCMYVCMKHERC